MRKIVCSFFLLFVVSTFSETDTTKSLKIYEYRPETLIILDQKIANPNNRENLKKLYEEFKKELTIYLENINYNSNKIFFLANEYMLMGNYEIANMIFLKDNSDIKNVFGAATTYRFMGKNEEAIKKYTEAISLNSMFSENYLGRALANRNMDNYDSAIVDLKKYISINSALDGYIALGDIYFKIGATKEAYQIVEEGLSRYPNSNLLKNLMRAIKKSSKNN